MAGISAIELLRTACRQQGVNLAALIAETTLWANPEVHRRLQQQGGAPAWYPGRRRYRAKSGEKKGMRIGDEHLDDNTYANTAIKAAVGVARQDVVGFEVCHVWPNTAYDVRYHTCIANLVLAPRPLAGLTDHDSEVQTALQYRAFELYGWHPEEVPKPVRPASYPGNWLEPMPFTREVEERIRRRGR